ncbi:MAG: ABC transporter permease, partial [Komagataeibacter rhaeticus]
IRTADGLRQTEPGWMGLARTMNAARWQVLTSWVACRQPSLASRRRMVPVVAPIGTVVGEWVGASCALGFRMQTGNIRFQTELMFAVPPVLAAVALRWGRLLARALPAALACGY